MNHIEGQEGVVDRFMMRVARGNDAKQVGHALRQVLGRHMLRCASNASATRSLLSQCDVSSLQTNNLHRSHNPVPISIRPHL